MNTCPSCNQSLTHSETTGSYNAYHCNNHGMFKISHTLMAMINENPDILPRVAEEINEQNDAVICTYIQGIS